MDKDFLFTVGAVIALAALCILQALGYPVFLWIAVVACIAALGFIAWHFPITRKPVIVIVVILILGSGAWEYAKGFNLPVRVNIDNSVKVYPVPTDNAAVQDWLHKKVDIGPGEGAQKVFLSGWAVAFIAFWVLFGLVWLGSELGIEWLTKTPIVLVFFLVWVVIALLVFAIPVKRPGMDLNTGAALTAQWTLGLTKEFWWPLSVTILSGAITWLQGKAAKVYILGLIVSAGTWLLLQLYEASLDPTMVSWTLCSNMITRTGVTNNLCQQAYALGEVSALAATMAWAWLWPLLKIMLGISSGKEKTEPE